MKILLALALVLVSFSARSEGLESRTRVKNRLASFRSQVEGLVRSDVDGAGASAFQKLQSVRTSVIRLLIESAGIAANQRPAMGDRLTVETCGIEIKKLKNGGTSAQAYCDLRTGIEVRAVKVAVCNGDLIRLQGANLSYVPLNQILESYLLAPQVVTSRGQVSSVPTSLNLRVRDEQVIVYDSAGVYLETLPTQTPAEPVYLNPPVVFELDAWEAC